MKSLIVLTAVLLMLLTGGNARAGTVAGNAINALGIDLLHQTAPAGRNALLSPYSIEMAMAMTCAGAAGETRAEMVRVLHLPVEEAQTDRAFAGLQTELAGIMERQAARALEQKQYGITNDPLTLTTAKRLFGEAGYNFRPAYLALLKDQYRAPFEPMDFLHNAGGAATHINTWVANQTHDRIQNLIPAGALTKDTRLVLVNAIYLKAPWETKFEERDTVSRPFHLAAAGTAAVPTMYQKNSLGYARRAGYRVVVLPYAGSELQLVILLPDADDGLAALAARLMPDMLAECASLPEQEVDMYLPKFKLEPPLLSLGKAMQALGMHSAFDQPPGSANFDGMAPRRGGDGLYISDIYHKTFLKLDESGTEAAAATAVHMMTMALQMHPVPPEEVRVDHPFLLALQHVNSGACLFLGEVTDPR
jgi:serpin B